MTEELKNEIDSKNPALPIYRRLAEGLKSRIISGKLPNNSRLPSEAELSEQLAINLRTLRKGLKILSDQGLISQCQGRGTFVTYSQPEKWLRFGLLLPSAGSLHDLYSMRILSALEATIARRERAELILLRIANPTTARLLEEINRTHCDGLLIFAGSGERLFFQPEFDHIPMVFFNIERPIQIPENRFHVRLADGAITGAVKYLYDLGHRKIAYLSHESDNLERRNREFISAADALGLSKNYLRFSKIKNSYDAARDEMIQLLNSSDAPTAVICPGVAMSYGAWQGAMLCNRRIPEDISIIGFDVNIHTNPHMSSINQPTAQMAEKAIELLFMQQSCGKQLKQRRYDFKAGIEELGSCAGI